jgi:hypothetical protein
LTRKALSRQIEFARILDDKNALQRLHELAAADADLWEGLTEESTNPIVAGRAIDLSGELDCNHLNCLKAKVDDLFRRVWHYFDEIVVEGLSPYIASRMIEEDPERALRLIEHHSKMLLYVRRIGAEDLLVFRQKLPGCAQHYRRHLDEVGLTGLLERSSWLIDRLAEDGEVIELKPHNDHWDYVFRHPMIEHLASGGVYPEEDSADPKANPQRAVAEAVFKKYSAHLVSDVHTARRLSTPLAASVSLHTQVLDRSVPEAAEAEVALNLALPVLKMCRLES